MPGMLLIDTTFIIKPAVQKYNLTIMWSGAKLNTEFTATAASKADTTISQESPFSYIYKVDGHLLILRHLNQMQMRG